MSEWKEYKLRDVCLKIGSGATPTGGGNSYKLQGISLMRSQNILDFQFSRNGLAFIDDEQAYDLRNVTVEKDDILLNITGDSVARACKVPDSILPARVNQHVSLIRANRCLLDPDYLLYYIQSIKPYLLSISEIGATRRALTKGMIEDLDISLPPLPEQKSIASVLSSLDDKIDLLHRQNQTLEALAETLFRQWFVEENESLGIAKLKDFCNHLKANVNPLRQPDKIFHHYSIPAFDEGQEPEIALGREIRSNKYQVREGTLLISKLNPRFPRVWPILENVEENHSICSTEFQVIKPKDTGYFGFILCFLKSKTVKDELIQSTGGTSGSHQRVSPDDIFNLTVPVPNDDKLKEFNLITNPYWDKIKNNKRQINTLARLRDTLLPKLMSGEVRVKGNL